MKYTKSKRLVYFHYLYELLVQAVNRAGLSSLLAVMKFAIDRSPPTGGHVLDGLENNQVK